MAFYRLLFHDGGPDFLTIRAKELEKANVAGDQDQRQHGRQDLGGDFTVLLKRDGFHTKEPTTEAGNLQWAEAKFFQVIRSATRGPGIQLLQRKEILPAITYLIRTGKPIYCRPTPHMKNRICLAWFCDLDSPDQGRKKFRPAPLRVTPSHEVPAVPRRPKVKAATELPRMFDRR